MLVTCVSLPLYADLNLPYCTLVRMAAIAQTWGSEKNVLRFKKGHVMDDEDISSEELAKIVVGGDLTMLSIDELEKRITLLLHEIGRIKDDIATKKMSKEAAESIFRS